MASSAGFCFQKQGVSDEEMADTIDLLNDPCRYMTSSSASSTATSPTKGFGAASPPSKIQSSPSRSKNPSGGGASNNPNSNDVALDPEKPGPSNQDTGWELVVDKPQFKLWRRPLGGDSESYQSEYKAFGTYSDLPASAFFATQMDLSYRKQWDKFVIYLDVVDSDEPSCQEVVRWVTHFPYPMYPREYIYVRRACVDDGSNVLLLVSKATEHPGFPVQPQSVRVSEYRSAMVIKPHRTFNDNGFDYVLTYYDDPQSPFPAPAYKWMASYGVSEFVDKVYTAAKALHRDNQASANGTAPGGSGQSPSSTSRGILAQLAEIGLPASITPATASGTEHTQ